METLLSLRYKANAEMEIGVDEGSSRGDCGDDMVTVADPGFSTEGGVNLVGGC